MAKHYGDQELFDSPYQSDDYDSDGFLMENVRRLRKIHEGLLKAVHDLQQLADSIRK